MTNINSITGNKAIDTVAASSSSRAREILKMQIMAQLGDILSELVNTQSKAAQNDAEQDKELERKALASAALEHLADTLVDAVITTSNASSGSAPSALSSPAAGLK